MADVLGAISAVIAILQTAAEVVDRIQQARDEDAWSILLDRNQKEVKSLKTIMEGIKAVEELRTEAIIEEIAKIAELAEKVVSLLKTIEKSGFGDKFWHGKQHRTELSGFNSDIATAKDNLTLLIISAHVGLTQLANASFVLQVEKMDRVESQLKQMIDSFGGLEIHDLVKGRPVNSNGEVPLQDSDLKDLEITRKEDPKKKDRFWLIDKNMTYDQAMMINGTIGTEGFIKPEYLRILNNVARNQSAMVNAPISDEQMDKQRDYGLKVIEIMANAGRIGNAQ